ncbi:hypothetical protein GGR50DRAFT_665469 [Xylaria sp. CBS 124048]|nr:hypothetical protein GGR50DRAFT_665469 [Xylaria sp. CBS 124048]
MLGVDYSPRSVQFARRVERARRRGDVGEGEEKEAEPAKEAEKEEEDKEEEEEEVDVHFAEHDILHSPSTALLDAKFSTTITRGWDVLLDKGTFDAVSLSDETLPGDSGSPRRINEAYGSRILPLIREGGLFLITSCNWVEAELQAWFEEGSVQEIPADDQQQQSKDGKQAEASTHWGFEVVGRIEYRSFSFGGVKGQTISSLCFRKVRKP